MTLQFRNRMLHSLSETRTEKVISADARQQTAPKQASWLERSHHIVLLLHEVEEDSQRLKGRANHRNPMPVFICVLEIQDIP